MAKQMVPLRTALMPLYYKDFHCLAGDCQDNCCGGGWNIEFSKKDYLTIKRAAQSQEMKDRLATAVARLREKGHDGMYACFVLNEQGGCDLQREDGLCGLQVECGAEALPMVCRTFPRIKHYSAAAQEHYLSPACEGVLALLWDHPEGINFWEEPLKKQDWWNYTADTPVEARFGDIRSFCIDVLQERSLTLRQRMLLLGFLFQRLQNMDWEREETADLWLAQSASLLKDPAVAEELGQLKGNRKLFLGNNHRHLLRSAITL